MPQAVIIEAVRTPVGKRNGLLKDTHPTELAAAVLNEVVCRVGVEAGQVEDIIMGCVSMVGDQALNIGRNSALLAGFPPEVPAVTIDRQCGSSQQAVHFAASLIESGAAEIVIAAGVESMTRVPMGSTRANGPGNPFTDALKERYPMVQMGLSAEMIAEKWRLPREALDEFSLCSHRLAAQAISEGFFRREILPLDVTVDGAARRMDSDEGVRPDTSLEKLATLKTPFKEDGVITAGNASQISDGAAALLLMSEGKAAEMGLKPRARIVAQVVVGDDPVLALTAPIPATRKILAKAGLKLDQMDLIEINEAFASVVLAWANDIQPDMERVNVNGGAIALGHPLGASGARIMTTLLHELERREGRYGLQTMCCFGGLGIATIIERIG
ncbi:MAG: acyl-CoA dehydrogenase [Chloroflexota bacterium]|nr:MAG: acyl-CoA dehydrogenase [Chloroflexota bacterium]